MRTKYLLLIALFFVQALAVTAVSYEADTVSQEGLNVVSEFPRNIAGWKGTDYPLEPRIYELLETRSIIHRYYENMNRQKILLSVVYYAESKVDFHTPEACLGGRGGIVKSSHDKVFIDDKKYNLNVNRLVRQGDNWSDNQLVYYFYKAGSFMGRSYLGLRLNLAINKFTDSSKSGALIRVSTVIPTEIDTEDETRMLKEFISDLAPYIQKYL